MVEYIPVGIFRSSFKFCKGDKLREKMEGGKRDERFSVHFNLQKSIQIVYFKNFENCRSPFKNEILHQESSQDTVGKKH
jgi:hypothetical protein